MTSLRQPKLLSLTPRLPRDLFGALFIRFQSTPLRSPLRNRQRTRNLDLDRPERAPPPVTYRDFSGPSPVEWFITVFPTNQLPRAPPTQLLVPKPGRRLRVQGRKPSCKRALFWMGCASRARGIITNTYCLGAGTSEGEQKERAAGNVSFGSCCSVIRASIKKAIILAGTCEQGPIHLARSCLPGAMSF
jgi:hypothetical protein